MVTGAILRSEAAYALVPVRPTIADSDATLESPGVLATLATSEGVPIAARPGLTEKDVA